MSRIDLIKTLGDADAKTFNRYSKAYEQGRADERAKTINEVKQYLLKHAKTVKEIETGDIYDAVKIEWIIDLNER